MEPFRTYLRFTPPFFAPYITPARECQLDSPNAKIINFMLNLVKLFESVSVYNNWRDYDDSELHNEYQYEYKYHIEPSFGLLFKNYEDFKKEINKSKKVKWPPSKDRITKNRSHLDSIEELIDMTSNYQYPRDISRIVKGVENNEALPRPIVLKFGEGNYWIMSGNSRMTVFEIYDIIPEVILLDVSDRR